MGFFANFSYFLSRINLKSLMFVMKFVYKFHDMDDVEELYHMTKRAGINLSMKPLDVVKNETVLPNPLAITDYLAFLDPKSALRETTKHKSWNGRKYLRSTEFRPALTDNGVCQTYNSHYEKDVFTEESVSQFHEIFHQNIDTSDLKLKSGAMKEFTFILDTQDVRRNYPFVTKDGTHFAR